MDRQQGVGTRQSRRRQEMEKNFLRLREEGYSMAQIAKKYELPLPTVFEALTEIAHEEDIPMEELLDKPMDADRSGRVREPAKSFNLAEFKKQAEEVKARIHEMQGLILGLLAGEE